MEEYLPRDTEGLEVRAGIAQQIYVVFDSIFGNGSQVTTHNLGKVDRFSSVAVSITEVDLNGNPFVARAGMQVMNVVPRDGGLVDVAWAIGWDSPLHARLYFIIVNQTPL